MRALNPIRLNTKIADRRWWISLFLSAGINVGVMMVLSQQFFGFRDHIFFLLLPSEAAIEMEIGLPLAAVPALPRFASAAVIQEDRIDLDRFSPDAMKDHPVEVDTTNPAELASGPVLHEPLTIPDSRTSLTENREAVWERGWQLDDPDVRLAPDAADQLAPLPVKGASPSLPVIPEERFAPAGFEPVLEHSRPGAVETTSPSVVEKNEAHRHEAAGLELGSEEDLVRAIPIRARLVVIESPGVYRQIDALQSDVERVPRDKNVVWLVEEKRIEPKAAPEAVVDGRNHEHHVSDETPAVLPRFSDRHEAQPRDTAVRVGSSRSARRLASKNSDEPESLDAPGVLTQLQEPVDTTASENVSTNNKILPLGGGFAVMYPARSRRRGETGEVVVDALIGLDGRVLSTKVEESSGFPALDEAASDAVRRAHFRFRPEADHAEPVHEKFVMVFKLN